MTSTGSLFRHFGGVGLVAAVELGPDDETGGAPDGAAVDLTEPQAYADLARFEALAALAEAAVLDDDLGREPAEPEPAVGRDGERLHVVAACLGDDAVEHPGDERGGVGGVE